MVVKRKTGYFLPPAHRGPELCRSVKREPEAPRGRAPSGPGSGVWGWSSLPPGRKPRGRAGAERARLCPRGRREKLNREPVAVLSSWERGGHCVEPRWGDAPAPGAPRTPPPPAVSLRGARAGSCGTPRGLTARLLHSLLWDSSGLLKTCLY